jgi:hypothetical protein
VLCLIDTVWIVMAFTSHTSPAEIAWNIFIPSVPAGGITTSLVFLVIAIVGTTIARGNCFSNKAV